MEGSNFKVSEMIKLRLEMAVYASANHFWEGYKGGTWSFSRKGRFWYPHETKVKICNPMNFFEGVLSGKTAGIALSMFATNQLCWKFHNEGKLNNSEFWGEYYYSLRSFLLENFTELEQGQVVSFLD